MLHPRHAFVNEAPFFPWFLWISFLFCCICTLDHSSFGYMFSTRYLHTWNLLCLCFWFLSFSLSPPRFFALPLRWILLLPLLLQWPFFYFLTKSKEQFFIFVLLHVVYFFYFFHISFSHLLFVVLWNLYLMFGWCLRGNIQVEIIHISKMKKKKPKLKILFFTINDKEKIVRECERKRNRKLIGYFRYSFSFCELKWAKTTFPNKKKMNGSETLFINEKKKNHFSANSFFNIWDSISEIRENKWEKGI